MFRVALMLTNLVEFYNLDANDDVVEIHEDVAASVTPEPNPVSRFLWVCVVASHLRLHDTASPFYWALFSGGLR
jgi:hypothetical protein